MFEISGLAMLSPIVGLYQVQVDGFAWLNQHDGSCNTGLTVRKEITNRCISQSSFCDQQQSAT